MKLGDMKCPWQPDKTMRECVILHEGPPLTVRDINDLKPMVSPFGPGAAPGPDGVVCAYGCDAWSIDSDCKQHKHNDGN